jgi:hypothetical protein
VPEETLQVFGFAAHGEDRRSGLIAAEAGLAFLVSPRYTGAQSRSLEGGQLSFGVRRMSITLSLPYDLSQEQWKIVDEVFSSLDGWLGYKPEDNTPQWYGPESSERFVWASIEPSGLLVEGNLDSTHWTGWISVLCARLSLQLGTEVCDAEM